MPALITALKSGQTILFVDECVFTSRSIQSKMWRNRSLETFIQKENLTFKAIPVLAAIDIEGRVISCIIGEESSIRLDDLLQFLIQIKAHYGRRKVVLFLDNLKLHYNHDFVRQANQYKYRLIYNASYSSHLNPIERLWALAKRSFGREILSECNLRFQSDVRAFVAKSIVQVPRESLMKHIRTCFKRIVTDLAPKT